MYQLQGYVDRAATAAGIMAAAAAPAPAALAATPMGAAATGNNRNVNSVLPEGYTNMLKKKLKECVDKRAREVGSFKYGGCAIAFCRVRIDDCSPPRFSSHHFRNK